MSLLTKESTEHSPNPFDLSVKKFNNAEVLTPKLVTDVFKEIWGIRTKNIGLKIEIPFCDRTSDELEELRKKGLRIGYMPKELASKENMPLLLMVFYQLLSEPIDTIGDRYKNKVSGYGWFDYEATEVAPNLNTTEDQLRKIIKKQGRQEMNLNEYVVAGMDNNLFANSFFDTQGSGHTGSRLLGSTNFGNVIGGKFYARKEVTVGALYLYDRDGHYSDLGGRSVYYKTTNF